MHLDLFALHGDGLHRKVHSDGVPMSLYVVPCLKSVHYAGLPRPAVTNEDDLEQEVEVLLVWQCHQCLRIAGGHLLAAVLAVNWSLLPAALLFQ